MQDFSDTNVLSHFRSVAYVEDFYYILHRVHCQERGHVGYKKNSCRGMLMEFLFIGIILTVLPFFFFTDFSML